MTRFSIRTTTLAAAAAALLAAAPFLAAPALAQTPDLSRLLERLERLERDMRTVQLQSARGPSASAAVSSPSAPPVALDPGAGSAIARIDVRIGELETEIRGATGQVERTAHQIDQIGQRLDKLVIDVDQRLSALERAAQPAATAGVAAPGTPSVTADVPPPSRDGVLGTLPVAAVPPASGAPPAAATAAPALPPGSPKDRYDYAFNLLRLAQYDQAETALLAFLAAHPNDALAGNARYWLGETYYVRRKYEDSAKVFLESYQAAPKGSKAPDSLLKLGMALANLGKPREACATFDKLKVEFADPGGALAQKLADERKRADCK